MLNRRIFNQCLMGLPATILAKNITAGEVNTKEDKAVIFIFLSGGIAQQEFINPIPNAPIEFRSTRGAINTNADYQLGGDFKKLASLGKELTVVRSLAHKDANHESATHWLITSEPNFQNQAQTWPSHGSVVSRYHGTNHPKTGIPLYVKTNEIRYDDASYLGTKYIGYDANSDGVSNLFLKTDKQTFQNRKGILSIIDNNSQLKDIQLFKDWKALREQSIAIIEGSAAKAFDLKLEAEEKTKLFDINRNGFGKNCLLAARLVQNGVKFVTISIGGWDMHSGISEGFANRGAELDHFLSLLINELKERDLLDKTLLVVGSEFGRTPKINRDAGRDHWPNTNSLVFAGGGYNHGKVIGETNSNAEFVEGNQYNPKDLAWTIFDHLGIPKDYTIVDSEKRPRHLIDEQAKNILKG